MTDCAISAPTRPAASTAAPRARRTPRTRRTRPPGVPRWVWLLGVAVVPLATDDPDGRQVWVVSAGAGTTHAAAPFHDDPDAGHRNEPRGSRP